MRILFHTSDPDGTAAYSNQAREIIKRLKADGHFCRIGTKHPCISWRTLADGTEVFEATNTELINDMLHEEHFDYILTAWDTWILHDKVRFPREKWAQWLPVDTEFASEFVAKVAGESAVLIAMSRHGERELTRLGHKPMYAPCGIDTKTFKPKPEARAAFRAEFGLTDENFVVGSVGLNYEDDRKGFIPLMRAFKVFYERHPKSRLYLHALANAKGHVANAINLLKVARDIGVTEDSIIWPNQAFYFMGRITPEWLADCYNGMDVFCLPTRGEGFCVPLVESQACGIPVITSATTTGPELVGPGWLIPCDPLDDARWLPTGCDRLECRPSAVLEKLEEAWGHWKHAPEFWEGRKRACVTFAGQYDWDNVWPKYWRPILTEMERMKNEREKEDKTCVL